MMKTAEGKELAHRFIDALHKIEAGGTGDIDDMTNLFAKDARLTNAALHGKELTGPDGARKFWDEYRAAFGDVRSEFSHVIVDEHAAGLFWHTEGRRRDGQPIGYDGVSLLEWSEQEQGKISFFRGYYDTRELARELNVEERARGEGTSSPANDA
jgi:ketosteroid isomerase-like protein